MCGIAGFVDFNKQSNKQLLEKMVDVLHHRGPDDCGYSFYEDENKNIGLGHRRLSILDLSKHGHQPMSYENYEIVYNGEVYNFKDIRNELKKLNYVFESGSDTEVVLKAYHKWGVEAVNKFNGMFAIAIYDKEHNKLILLRDRLGKKPLYYYSGTDGFVYSSELKSIMLYPQFKKVIDKQALNMYLFHGYITAPYSIFKDTYKLEPGSYLVLDLKQNKIIKETYWSVANVYKNKNVSQESENEVIKSLDSILTSAVEYRMVSDVPIGSFLSGGYDSSLISAIMQKLSSVPIDTFTIGFDEKEFNEANYAKAVASHLGTNHHELYLPINDSEELIFDIPKYYDEPFADMSQIPTMLVSKLAKENVTVTLSGDGGDELFCGYGRYETILNYLKYKPVSRVYKFFNKFVNMDSLASKIDRRLIKLGYLDTDDNIVNFAYLYSKYYLKDLLLDSSYRECEKYFEIMRYSSIIQEKHMLQDMVTYLPDDILVKVDRASMAYSLESRTPLLDYRVVEYSMNLPHSLKYKNGDKKHILKELTHRYIDKKIMDRPKMGFGIPVYKWLHTDLNYLVKKYFNEAYLKQQNIFNLNKIKVILNAFNKDNGDEYFDKLVWHILVFQLWYEEYMT